MRGFRNVALIAGACLAVSGMAAQLTPSPTQLLAIDQRRAAKPARKKVKLGFAEDTPRWKRSRGARTKPKKHRNMRHVAKRVRLKHRRAARG